MEVDEGKMLGPMKNVASERQKGVEWASEPPRKYLPGQRSNKK